jgi:hypothetical protein
LSRARLAVSAIALTAATVPASAVLAVPALADAGSPRVPTSVTGFTATADPQGMLTVRGCVQDDSDDADLLVGSAVKIQYGPGGSGPWRTLGAVREVGHYTSTCPGVEVAGTDRVPRNWAYYRVAYAGTWLYAASASDPVLVWKYLDRIEHPTITRSGTHVTARGQLQHYYNGWKPSAGQQVKIVLEPKGGTKWYWIAQPRTNAAGWFTATVRATVSAHWAASYPGDSTHFAAGSPQTWISG